MTDTWQALPNDTYTGVCPAANTVQNVKIKTVQVISNPKDSRPYPSGSLLQSLTASALQSTFESDYHGEHQFLVGLNESCSGVLHTGTKTYDNNYYIGAGLAPYGSADVPQWETRARLKIKDASVNLGTALAEYRQTTNMFGKFAQQAWSGWKSFKGKKRRRKLTVDDVAAAQLISSYGLSPLMGDVSDSLNRLQFRLQEDIIQRVVVTAKTDNTVVRDSPSGNGYNVYETAWERSDRVILYVKLAPNPASFTLGNPLEVAWELVPFSFLVDQFLDVGDYLSSLDALNGVESITGTRTIKRRARSIRTTAVNPGFAVIHPQTSDYKSHQRVLQTGIPLPRVPSWNPSTSFKTLANDIALLKLISSKNRR